MDSKLSIILTTLLPSTACLILLLTLTASNQSCQATSNPGDGNCTRPKYWLTRANASVCLDHLCDSCARNLIDQLDDVEKNLEYSGDSIQSDKLKASLELRLTDLNQRSHEHKIALENSADSLSRYSASLVNLVSSGSSTSNLSDIITKASLYLDQIENDTTSANLDMVRLKTNVVNIYNSTFALGTSSRLLNDKLDTQIGAIKLTCQKLKEINNNNYMYDTKLSQDLIEIDGRQVKRLLNQSTAFIEEQTRDGLSLKSAISELSNRIAKLTKLSIQIESNKESNPEILILDYVFRNTSSCNQCLDKTYWIAVDSLNKTTAINSKIRNLTQLMDSNQQSQIKLIESKHELESLSEDLRNKLQNVHKKFEITAQDMSSLINQMTNISSLDVNLANLNNHSFELASKLSSLDLLIKRDLITRQAEIFKQRDTIATIYRDNTNSSEFDWELLVNCFKLIEAIDGNLNESNESLANLEKYIGDLTLLEASNDRAELAAPSLNDLIDELTASRSIVRDITERVDRTRQQAHSFDRELSFNYPNRDGNIASLESPNLEDDMNEANQFVIDTGNFREIISNVTREFSDELDRILVSRSSDRSLENFELKWLDKEREELLNISNSSIHVSELNRFAQINIGQLIQSLREKIEHTRAMLDLANLARNFNYDPNRTGLKLRNPENLEEISTYNSVSFYMKPSEHVDGLILFIGTPMNDRQPNQCPIYAEYLAVEMRNKKIAVVLRLGSQNLNEVEDDVELMQNRWYRIAVDQIGTILSLCVKSDQSESSLTRSIRGPHTALKLTNAETDILVSGIGASANNSTCFPPDSIRSKIGFSGVLDNLRLNNKTMGLWNTEFSEKLTQDEAYSSREWAVHEELRENLEQSLKPVQLAYFPRPKSNISSPFLQFPDFVDELTEVSLQQSGQVMSDYSDRIADASPQIRKLTVRFKTQQSNALLLHHSSPDHSYFMSLYISAGRLMLAVNFEVKLRIESDFVLNDARWHLIYLTLSQSETPRTETNFTTPSREAKMSSIIFKVNIVVDDRFLFRDKFSTNVEPSTSQNWLVMQSRKLLCLGGVEDKYIPLLRNQQIPTSFHGCIADVTINDVWLNFERASKNQGVVMNGCYSGDR